MFQRLGNRAGLSNNGYLLLVAFAHRESRSEEKDAMRPEYDFDYPKARRNPYAARLKGQPVAVLLAPDVAPSFPTADSVNDILQAVINAVPRPPRRPVRLKAQAPRKAG